MELDPISILQNRQLGIAFFVARQYDSAIEQLEKTLELDPSFTLTREYLTYAYWLNGMEEEAIAEAKKLDERLGRFYELLKEGKLSEATQLSASLPNNDRLILSVQYYIAGDEEKLFEQLEKAYQERDPQLAFTLSSPYLDPLRSDPRFQDLRQRMNLPE